MKELCEFIAKFLVDEPDRVEIETLESQNAMILQVKVAPDDMGKIIGRNGRVAKALRELIRAAAVRDNKSALVDIVQ